MSILLWQEVFMTQVDFAIITIREDEFEAVLQRFPQKPQDGPSGRTYGISEVKTQAGQNCNVAIVSCVEQGTDSAQLVASDVINDLDPQMLLVVGIAGGVPDDVFTLGDVIVSSRINNFNVSKRYEDGREKFDMRGGIHPLITNTVASLHLYEQQLAGWNNATSIKLKRPTVDLSQFDTDAFKKKITESTDEDIASWYKDLQKSVTNQFGKTRAPLFKIGTIASSNSLIRNIDPLIQWLQDARTILAVEMEAAGVYQASQKISKQYPVMAIRGISDIVGLGRDNQWTKYACQTAAAFAYAFVTSGIVTPRKQSVLASTPTSAAHAGNKPIEVFISYAKDDEKFKQELEKHLKLLTRQKIIHAVHSQSSAPGDSWQQDTANQIDAAQVILLLVSQNFLASDQHYDYEMMHAMKKHETGAARVIPIILRPTNLKGTPFEGLRSLPRDDKPVGSPGNDVAWSKIAEELREVCVGLRNG
jgi:nucleoside phosphorylase